MGDDPLRGARFVVAYGVEKRLALLGQRKLIVIRGLGLGDHAG